MQMHQATSTDIDAHPPAKAPKSVVVPTDKHRTGAAERQAAVAGHLAAFDLNGDGMIDVWETVACLGRMRVPWLAALPVAFAIHILLSWPSQATWMPDPLLGIRVAGAARLHFGSSAGVYAAQADFRDAFPGEYSADGIGLGDIFFMRAALYDPVGWVASRFLWLLLWLLSADRRTQCIPWPTIERMADGTLYHDLLSATPNPRT